MLFVCEHSLSCNAFQITAPATKIAALMENVRTIMQSQDTLVVAEKVRGFEV